MLFKPKRKKIYMPEYLKKFKCLTTDCPNTCCQGWNVAINKEAFELMKKEVNSCTINAEEFITVNKDATNSDLYGNLNLKDSKCPLLTNDSLCSFQLKHGEQMLSKVCTTFPRVFNSVNGSLQNSARVSCPEIARLALLNQNKFKLIKFDYYIKDKNIEIANTINSKSDKNSLLYKTNNIQKYLIRILQDRTHTIEQRLSRLCFFIELLLENHKKNSIKTIFNSIENLIAKNKLFSDIYFQHEFLSKNIIFEHISTLEYMNFKKELPEIYDLLVYSSKISPFDYDEILEGKYMDFVKDYPYILENFLINWILNEIFPFKSQNIQYEILRFVINFAVIRFLIISEFSKQKVLSPYQVIEIISNYSRSFGNTELPKLKKNFEENKNRVFELLYVIINI